MAYVNVFIDEIGGTSASTLRVRFQAVTSLGAILPSDQLDVNTTGRGLAQVAAALKARVVTWAATPAGGSLSLTPKDVWICGLADDQISGVRTTADAPTSNPAFIDVPELNFTLAPSSHYKFSFEGAYTAALATTGLQLSVNGPASPNFMRAKGIIFTSTTAVFAGAIGAYDAAIAATASGGATALPFELTGTISTGATGGTFSLRFRTEVNGSAVTILRGSMGELISVA